MGQLATLGPAGRARGVDQGGRIGDLDGCQPGVELFCVDRLAGLGKRIERGRSGPVDAQHLAQLGQLAGQLLDLVGVRVGLGEHQHRAGIGQHEAHLFGRRSLVNWDGERADGQDRVVQDRPLVAGRRQDRNTVTGFDAFGDQSQSGRTNLGSDLSTRHVGPRAVDEALEDHMVGVFAFVGKDGADDVVVLADVERGGNTELTHGVDLSCGCDVAHTSLVGGRRAADPMCFCAVMCEAVGP